MMPPPEAPGDSRLVRTLFAGEFALTAEVTPPLSGDPAALLNRARPLSEVVDAVNVTDGAGAKITMSSLAAAALLAREGIDPILQFTCRDRNRIALLADLMGASALGIRNILVLRGDDPKAGDEPEAKPVFDYESRTLIEAAAGLAARGTLPNGRTVDHPPHFFIGAADTPTDPKPGWKPDGLRAKADAGAHFIQTQLCYDARLIRRYVSALQDEGLTERMFILIGTGPLRSARQAIWVRENLWGVVVPDAVVRRLERAADPTAEGVAICAELLQELASVPGIAGVHLMAPNNTESIPAAIARSGLRAPAAALAHGAV